MVLNAPQHVAVFDKTLTIFCNWSYPGIHSSFSTNEELKEFIDCNIESAFQRSILIGDVNHYYLNIAIPKGLGCFRDSDYIWSENTPTGICALRLYTPIINRFLQEAFQCTLDKWNFQPIDFSYFRSPKDDNNKSYSTPDTSNSYTSPICFQQAGLHPDSKIETMKAWGCACILLFFLIVYIVGWLLNK